MKGGISERGARCSSAGCSSHSFSSFAEPLDRTLLPPPEGWRSRRRDPQLRPAFRVASRRLAGVPERVESCVSPEGGGASVTNQRGQSA